MEFRVLVKRISPKLKGITYRLNGHFTFMNHDDLYQEALLRVWIDFKAGKLQDKTDSYILQGCYFHLKNYIRTVSDKAHLSSLESLATDESLDWEQRLPADDPDEYIAGLDIRLQSERILSGVLTDRERKLLSLFGEGLTVRQIGQRLGISHVGVLKIRNRIRKKCSYQT